MGNSWSEEQNTGTEGSTETYTGAFCFKYSYLNLIIQCYEQDMRSEFKETLIEAFSVSILKYDLPIYLTLKYTFKT